MNTTVEVFLWGTRIGIIHQDLNKPYATFEYDRNFSNSDRQVFPLLMPLSEASYSFPMLTKEPFFGLPGLVSDSLPDSFGNKVIEQWLVSQGKSLSDFTAIDRLCYMGNRGMGALEYKPSTTDFKDINENINVSKMIEFASKILENRESIILNANDELTYSQLIQVGSSAGGARAKALIAWNQKTNEIRSGQLLLDKDFDYWLMKFDNVRNNGDHGSIDNPQYTLIEYAYYKMALDAGIKMNECRIYSSDGKNHFMTKRFDRINGKKIHMLSLGGMAHISYKEPLACSYELAAEYMRQIGLLQTDLEQFYLRMVFNCFAVNQDDHVKNISFLMDKDGKWQLSPAYDITFSYDTNNIWLKQHQMSINNKSTNISLNDLLQAGKTMGIKKGKCISIIDRVKNSVSKFRNIAEDCGISESNISYIEMIITKESPIKS